MDTLTIEQKIFKHGHHLPIPVIACNEQDLTLEVIGNFLKLVEAGHIGLAPEYDGKCRLSRLAMATATQVLVITLLPKTATSSKKTSARLALEKVFSSPHVTAYAFKMDYLAAALYFDHAIRLSAGKRLLSVSIHGQLEGILAALGAGRGVALNRCNVIDLFRDEECSSNKLEITPLQAWAAYQAATMPKTRQDILNLPVINTLIIDEKWLKVITKTIRDMSFRIALKPTQVKNDVDAEFSYKSGKLEAVSTRFRTRLMRTTGQQVVHIETVKNGVPEVCSARVKRINGKSATLSLTKTFKGTSIHSVTTIGRECPTSAEDVRENIMLRALEGELFDENPFIQRIWLLKRKISWSGCPVASISPTFSSPSKQKLNLSQQKAVNAILSKAAAYRVVLIQGPPGTGKTTVIAASVISVMASSDQTNTLWLVAQSNVAVKNIAEKLATERFFDFKILVSKDFHFDWHEHLYEKIQRNFIRSDEFTSDVAATERLLLGSRVILCTISMLSNTKLGTLSRIVPPQTVIFDEASQIEIGDYFPMLTLFRSTLRKLVFIGDDKQLAPHGHSDIPKLGSIFEKAHLRDKRIFLDTQYRMPIPIGNFISENVYASQLKSEHPISNTNSCCFVDVKDGVEQSSGRSWQNLREVDVVLKVVKMLTSQGKSFRIITPYDPQRSLLENALKRPEEQLPWKDKCFNIDAFQGNEDDYIVISLVRTNQLGFLNESRRINVMLSRCKKGMIICTNRRFIEGKAKKSLVGKLAQWVGKKAWVDARQVLREGFQPFA